MTVKMIILTLGRIKKLIKSDEIDWPGISGELFLIFIMILSVIKSHLLVFPFIIHIVTNVWNVFAPQQFWCRRQLKKIIEDNALVRAQTAKSSWKNEIKKERKCEKRKWWLRILIKYQSGCLSSGHASSCVQLWKIHSDSIMTLDLICH